MKRLALSFLLMFLILSNLPGQRTTRAWKSLYSNAKEQLHIRNYEEALIFIDSFIENERFKNNFLGYKALLLRAEILGNTGQFDEAMELAELVLDSSSSLINQVEDEIVSSAKLTLGMLHCMKGDNYFRAITNTEQGLLWMEGTLDELTIAKGLNVLSYANLMMGIDHQAITYASKGLEILQDQDQVLKSEFLNTIARAYFNIGNPHLAEKHYKLIQADTLGIIDSVSLAKSYLGVPDIHIAVDDVDRGMGNLRKALDISNKISHEKIQFQTYQKLINWQVDNQDWENAIEAIDFTYDFLESSDLMTTERVIRLRSQKAEAYYHLGRYVDGLELLYQYSFDEVDSVSIDTKILFYKIISLLEPLNDIDDTMALTEYMKLMDKKQESVLFQKQSVEGDILNTRRQEDILASIDNEVEQRKEREKHIIYALLVVGIVIVCGYYLVVARKQNEQKEAATISSITQDVNHQVHPDQEFAIEKLLNTPIKLKEGEVHLAKNIIRLEIIDSKLTAFIEGRMHGITLNKLLKNYIDAKKFEEPLFLKPHQSHVINITKVVDENINSRDKEGFVILRDGTKVPVSVREKKKTRAVLYTYVIK